MNDMHVTDYLYHYTSIDILALILKNHTIRLTPLDRLDDLQERNSADVSNLGRFDFVSSWTEDEKESIPMWNMYTDPASGVRIRLRKNPFVKHANGDPSSTKSIGTFLNIIELLSCGYYCDQAWSGDILKKVDYTDDLSLLEPKVLDVNDKQISVNIGRLGQYKSKYWEFQKEWRYILRFVPFDISNGPEMAATEFYKTVNDIARGTAVSPIDYYDLQIAPECFKEMEITCSPKITAGNRIVLNALVEKYNPEMTVHDSVLLGKL